MGWKPSVVIKACCTTLKERGDNHHPKLFGEFAIEFRRRSWDGFCEVEVVHIFHLAEIQGVVQFLQNNQLGPAFRKVANAF